jgi:hypothetical protein
LEFYEKVNIKEKCRVLTMSGKPATAREKLKEKIKEKREQRMTSGKKKMIKEKQELKESDKAMDYICNFLAGFDPSFKNIPKNEILKLLEDNKDILTNLMAFSNQNNNKSRTKDKSNKLTDEEIENLIEITEARPKPSNKVTKKTTPQSTTTESEANAESKSNSSNEVEESDNNEL